MEGQEKTIIVIMCSWVFDEIKLIKKAGYRAMQRIPAQQSLIESKCHTKPATQKQIIKVIDVPVEDDLKWWVVDMWHEEV